MSAEGVEKIDAESEVNKLFSRAILNLLEDFSAEKDRLNETQRAILNILEDFSAEKTQLESTQKAILNILEDFDDEKKKVNQVNAELRREVAERSVAERALTRKTEELGRSNAELEQFAYVASHDLQEPLRMVSSYVQLFAKRYAGSIDENSEKYINYAVEGAQRMQALIAGLLEYSRIGRQNIQTDWIDAQTCAQQALDNLKSAAEDSAAEVTIAPLPRVRADPLQLTQVFQNLLANAIKFHRAGMQPKIAITFTQDPQENCVFRIKDDGIGIDPRHADRIFVIFQRLHARSEYAGTGIGLSICKRVIERHGGNIWVETNPQGYGASFVFSLPGFEP